MRLFQKHYLNFPLAILQLLPPNGVIPIFLRKKVFQRQIGLYTTLLLQGLLWEYSNNLYRFYPFLPAIKFQEM